MYKFLKPWINGFPEVVSLIISIHIFLFVAGIMVVEVVLVARWLSSILG